MDPSGKHIAQGVVYVGMRLAAKKKMPPFFASFANGLPVEP
jgi:hypothetical protein